MWSSNTSLNRCYYLIAFKSVCNSHTYVFPLVIISQGNIILLVVILALLVDSGIFEAQPEVTTVGGLAGIEKMEDSVHDPASSVDQ